MIIGAIYAIKGAISFENQASVLFTLNSASYFAKDVATLPSGVVLNDPMSIFKTGNSMPPSFNLDLSFVLVTQFGDTFLYHEIMEIENPILNVAFKKSAGVTTTLTFGTSKSKVDYSVSEFYLQSVILYGA